MFDLVELAAVDPHADEAALIEQIAWLERVKSAASAGQVRARRWVTSVAPPRPPPGCPRPSRVGGWLVRWRWRAAIRRRAGVGIWGWPRRWCVRCRTRWLHCNVVRCRSGGRPLIAREWACLEVEDRRRLDAELCADVSTLDGMGDARIVAAAKEIAARLDAQAVVDRAARAAADRSVTIRSAPDCMTYVTVLLPVAQGVGVYAALKRQADTTFDDRSRGQVMADTLVERVTGKPAEEPEHVALNLVMSDQALWGQDNAPAVVDGYGPIPASLAQRLVRDAVVDQRALATLRRLYRDPKSGSLVAMESRSRLFPKGLAGFIGVRDRTCRTPYCDAPIRHRDHATPRNRGGPTSATNGLGECERCNYAKEAPGWRVSSANENGTHTAEFVTPTGARYRSTAPPLPGAPVIAVSELEIRIGIELADLHAA
jgi:hypothetical protein